MATLSATSTGGGASTALPTNPQPTILSEFSGEAFSNNLFSDLAPLLTLFGEQVTKQFLSMSLGWADNILLAVGPLGIITTMVSVIRVANIGWMKALVGRAREKLATAELELLSSTSDDTSELWTDEGIVRQPGHANTLELVVYEQKVAQPEFNGRKPEQGSHDSSIQVLKLGDLGEACEDGILEEVDKKQFAVIPSKPKKLSPKQLAKQPPNLSLNIEKALARNEEIWMFAILGIAMQAVALIIPGFMTYHWKVKDDDKVVQDYAYPLFLVGSCAAIMGIALCSHIIEATTVEQKFRAKEPSMVKRIFRLQLGCNMGDQEFGTYVVLNELGNDKAITSRFGRHTSNDALKGDPETGLGDVVADPTGEIEDAVTVPETGPNGPASVPTIPLNDLQNTPSRSRKPISGRMRDLTSKTRSIINHQKLQMLFTMCAITLCFAGFVCQFVGLRALHWSATIIQLGVTLLMTGIRAWVRRGLSRKPRVLRLPESDPNVMALVVGSACRGGWPGINEPWPNSSDYLFGPYTKPRMLDPEHEPVLITTKDPRLALRHKLGSYSPDDHLHELATNLSAAMCEILSMCSIYVNKPLSQMHLTWTHLISTTKDDRWQPQLRLALSCYALDHDHLIWADSYDPVYSIIALWEYNTADRGNYYSRCIDTISESQDFETRKKELEKWSGEQQFHFLREEGIGAQWGTFLRRQKQEEEEEEEEEEEWAGTYGVPFLERQRQKVREEREEQEEHRFCDFFGMSFGTMPNYDMDRFGYLLKRFDYPMATQFVLELYSGFVSALAEKLHSFHLDDPSPLYMVERVSDILLESRLVDKMEDARILVIPHFRRRGLLPGKPPQGWLDGSWKSAYGLDGEDSITPD